MRSDSLEGRTALSGRWVPGRRSAHGGQGARRGNAGPRRIRELLSEDRNDNRCSSAPRRSGGAFEYGLAANLSLTSPFKMLPHQSRCLQIILRGNGIEDGQVFDRLLLPRLAVLGLPVLDK